MTEKPDVAQISLERGLGVWQATALNIANMVGIGPFITIPAFIASMHGPHAVVGWIIAAVLILCDGLVWSELGAAMPGSGGTYHFLRQIFGQHPWGKILPFLFIWQFLVSVALELASGYIGTLAYLEFAWPALPQTVAAWGLPGGTRWVAVLAVLFVTLALCRKVSHLGIMGLFLCAGTLITVVSVIVCGLMHFNADLLATPDNAFRLDSRFAIGLGGAMSIAIYDYLGYFNVCHLGDEVRQPGKTIPRAIMLSIIIVACLYLTMNISIMAVVPWQIAMDSKNIAADFMERLFDHRVAVGFTWLIVWTGLAGMFAGTLAYSRIPYAAAKAGDFFSIFAYLHPKGRYPIVSLLALGVFTAGFCFLSLQSVIDAAVCVRILVQFVGQIFALHMLRTTRPDISMPFRMWFYPLPSLIALVGWLFVLGTSAWLSIQLSLFVMCSGVIAYFIRQRWTGPQS